VGSRQGTAGIGLAAHLRRSTGDCADGVEAVGPGPHPDAPPFSSTRSADTASASWSLVRAADRAFRWWRYHSLATINDMTSFVPVQIDARRRSRTMRSTGKTSV